MSKWMRVKLGSVAHLIRGVSFDKFEASTEAQAGSVPILRAGNIGDRLLVTADLVWVPSALVSSEQLLQPGDVAICMSSGSAAVVGKTAYLEESWHGSVGAFCAIIRFHGIHPRLGAYWLRSPGFFAWRDTQAQGANIQNLRKAELEKLEFDVPADTAEQERIVRLLDEAAALRRLRTQADERTAAAIPALFDEMFGDPAANPKNWPVVPVSRFVKQFQAGRSIAPAGDDCASGAYRIIKVSAVTWGSFAPEESKPVPDGVGPLPEHFVRAGDLLFSRANTAELVGATVLVESTPENLLLPDKIWRFIWNEGVPVEPRFVLTLFQHPSVRRELGNRATGTGGSMKNISMGKVMLMEVPLPPLALQRTYAACVAEIRALEAEQAVSRKRLDDLFQSLLHRAFSGDL